MEVADLTRAYHRCTRKSEADLLKELISEEELDELRIRRTKEYEVFNNQVERKMEEAKQDITNRVTAQFMQVLTSLNAGQGTSVASQTF